MGKTNNKEQTDFISGLGIDNDKEETSVFPSEQEEVVARSDEKWKLVTSVDRKRLREQNLKNRERTREDLARKAKDAENEEKQRLLKSLKIR